MAACERVGGISEIFLGYCNDDQRGFYLGGSRLRGLSGYRVKH